MKKFLIIFITLLVLTGCDRQSNKLEVNDPLKYSVSIKDNAEFILIKEGTSIEEATKIIKDNLDIDTNADSYDLDWYGEAYAAYYKEDIENLIEEYGAGGKKIEEKKNIADDFKKIYQVEYEHLGDEIYAKELTLNNESIRPIELILDFKKDDETITEYKQILVCISKEDIYDVLSKEQPRTIEGMYSLLNKNGLLFTDANKLVDYVSDMGYASNLR